MDPGGRELEQRIGGLVGLGVLLEEAFEAGHPGLLTGHQVGPRLVVLDGEVGADLAEGGVRPELAPGGEAHLKRHGPDSGDEDFESYLFARANPKGAHLERWRHAYGCGKWFLAARDTVTLEVYGTYKAQTPFPTPEIVAAIQARHPDWTPDFDATSPTPTSTPEGLIQ